MELWNAFEAGKEALVLLVRLAEIAVAVAISALIVLPIVVGLLIVLSPLLLAAGIVFLAAKLAARIKAYRNRK